MEKVHADVPKETAPSLPYFLTRPTTPLSTVSNTYAIPKHCLVWSHGLRQSILLQAKARPV